MESIVFAAFTALLWMSSMSILLPLVILLKFNKSFQNRWFSWCMSRCLKPMFEPKLLPLRKQAFQLLKNNLPKQNKSIPLKVLEIGIGSGANLEFYPENSHLIAVDMNASFEPYFNNNKKKYPQVVYERTVICMAEDMPDIEDSSIDCVISTYVLCSVLSVEAVLKEVKRVLKPDGQFLFLEHMVFPKTEWSSTVQRFINPLWSIYFNGCCVNRDHAEQVRKAGFSQVTCEKMYPPALLFFIRPQVMGIATK